MIRNDSEYNAARRHLLKLQAEVESLKEELEIYSNRPAHLCGIYGSNAFCPGCAVERKLWTSWNNS